MSSSDPRGERTIEDILAAIRTGRPIEEITSAPPASPAAAQPAAASGTSPQAMTGPQATTGRPQGWPAEPQQPAFIPPVGAASPAATHQTPRPDPVLPGAPSVGLPVPGQRTIGRPAPLTGRLAEAFGAEPSAPFATTPAAAPSRPTAPSPAPEARPSFAAAPTASAKPAAVVAEDDDLSDLLGDPIAPERTPSQLAVPAAPSAEASARAPSFGTAFAPPANVRGPREAGADDPSAPPQATPAAVFDFSAMVPVREAGPVGGAAPAPDAAEPLSSVVSPAPAEVPKPAEPEVVAARPAPVVIAAMPRSSAVASGSPSAAPETPAAPSAPVAARSEAAAPAVPEAVAKPQTQPDEAAPAAMEAEPGLDQDLETEADADAELPQAAAPPASVTSILGIVAAKPYVNGNHAKAPTAPTASARPPQGASTGLPRSAAAPGTPAKPQPAQAPHAPGTNGSAVAKPGKDPIANLRVSVAAPAPAPAPTPAPAQLSPVPATPTTSTGTTSALQPSAGHATIFPPAISEVEGGVQRVRTMEDTVAELLRPMLREWLDANMPRIVEKALRIEIAESVRKKLDGGTKG